MALELTSAVFAPGEAIPARYTCDGEDISPPLAWSDPPPGTRSYSLIADDPDAPVGTWVHWVLFNLPADSRGLPEGVPDDAELSDGSLHGHNGWRRLGYGGPCPPPGKPHRYYFKLYALDAALTLPFETNKAQLEEAMKNHILGEAQVMGTYKRQSEFKTR